MQAYEDYKHCTPIQIRFKDIDKQGHVNNANHLTYFETARTQYFKDVIRTRINWAHIGIILARTEIDYKRPILLEDELYCYTKVLRFGTKSFDMLGALMLKTTEGLVAAAFVKSVIVGMNYETKETIAIPEAWKKEVMDFEKAS